MATSSAIHTIFNLPLHAVEFAEAVNLVSAAATRAADRPSIVVTPNVDHLVKLAQMPAFQGEYARADFIFADGMPLVWFSRLIGRPLPARVTGADLFVALCEKAVEHSWQVAVVGGRPGMESELYERFAQRYPGLKVKILSPSMGFNPEGDESAALAKQVAQLNCQIIFVCLGFPKQEIWALHYGSSMPGGAMLCVGAALEFALGIQRRAPRWMQRAGFEWLWRLLSNPRRLWRRYLVDSWSFVRLCWQEWRHYHGS